jgi:YHS domain-containing protein
VSVPIATGSTERKFAEPTHLHFCHVTINDMAQRDPVCNMMVDEKKAQHISEANGQKIYLCSAQCKTQFDQNPNKYGY